MPVDEKRNRHEPVILIAILNFLQTSCLDDEWWKLFIQEEVMHLSK